MANSNWSFDEYKRPEKPSDRAVPQQPRSDRIPQPDALDAFLTSVGLGWSPFTPAAELAAEGLVDIFVHELDILDCQACFAQHFTLGETCRKHDV